MKVQIVTGNIVDIFNQKVYHGRIEIVNGKVNTIEPISITGHINPQLPFVLPGFIDAHVHIESSMLIPAEFARLAVVHGTVATVSDPHEIANVCGYDGVEFMIENGKTVPFKFYFGAPSCVPATIFETAGAELNAREVEKLLRRDDILYLSEMMNFPGVLHKDTEVMKKIAAAQLAGKPIDGHAPGLRGAEAKAYIDAGISTDHECFTREEALEKLQCGMKIIIREGSAAKNFDALVELLHDYPNEMMFCSDDKHPDSLVNGHINQLCARAVDKGINVYSILKAACINPVLHYKLPVGLLRTGDTADFIIIKDLINFEVIQTYINGELVAEKGKSFIESRESGVGSRKWGAGSKEQEVRSRKPEDGLPNRQFKSTGRISINNFSCTIKKPADFIFSTTLKNSNGTVSIIEALDGQLITNKIEVNLIEKEGILSSNINEDILKIVVVNRYTNAPIAKAFIKNFGLKRGAIASSVAHDSHNIVAVGVNDENICKAVNLIITGKGGVSCVDEEVELILALPVAGLMSNEDGYKVAAAYTAIDSMAKSLGSTLSSPFMTLSFMALLVIPHLKLSDKGLFDGDTFKLMGIS